MRLEPSSSGVAAARQETLPLFHAAWLFAAGVAATHFLWLRPWLLPAAMIPTAILCCVAAFKAQRMLWLPLAVLWALLGAWCGLMEPWPAPVPQVASFSDGLMRTLEGTAVDVGPVRSQIEQDVNDDGVYGPEPEAEPTQRVDVQLARLEEAADSIDRQIPVAGTVRLTLRWPAGTNVEAIAETFHCGDHIRADARLLRPAVYHDPGVWSRADYLLGQGITSTAGVAIDRVAIDRSGDSADVKLRCRLSTLQHAMTARLMGLPATTHGWPAPLRISQEDAVMLAAMVAGDRTFLTHSLRAGFERTGSFHMLVVSGFHLAVVAGCVFWFALRVRPPSVPATLFT